MYCCVDVGGHQAINSVLQLLHRTQRYLPVDRHLGGSNAAVSSVEIDSTLIVRDCFLCCMAELVGGICSAVRQSDANRPRYNLR